MKPTKSTSNKPLANVELLDYATLPPVQFRTPGDYTYLTTYPSSLAKNNVSFLPKWINIDFNQTSKECLVLRDAVSNLWALYRYNQHLIGFMNGGVSSEDFNAAAELYAKDPRHLDWTELKAAAEVILPLIQDSEFTPSDLAIALNVDAKQLELTFSHSHT